MCPMVLRTPIQVRPRRAPGASSGDHRRPDDDLLTPPLAPLASKHEGGVGRTTGPRDPDAGAAAAALRAVRGAVRPALAGRVRDGRRGAAGQLARVRRRTIARE